MSKNYLIISKGDILINHTTNQLSGASRSQFSLESEKYQIETLSIDRHERNYVLTYCNDRLIRLLDAS